MPKIGEIRSGRQVNKKSGRYIFTKCKSCGTGRWVYLSNYNQPFFSEMCFICSRSGSNNNLWKGGTHLTSEGYRMVTCKGHPNADKQGYILEHRLIMEKHVDRLLIVGEVVHHINGNILDNRIENLELMTIAQHTSHHFLGKLKLDCRSENSDLRMPNEINYLTGCKCGCGSKIQRFDKRNRRTFYIRGHSSRVNKYHNENFL